MTALTALAFLVLFQTVGGTQPQPATPAPGNPTVLISTSLGDITVELYNDRAPVSVQNFLQYVNEGFYPGTIFHRVISGFMIQGGGFTTDMVEKPTRPPIRNEATNGLTNVRGTLAMARTEALRSATAQFFINVADNDFLDYKAPSANGWGYCVFGKVVEGQDVVDRIRAVATANSGFHQNVPKEDVVITKAEEVAA
jgi:peptidyl-prolyl cis-trans isomerase B (cyclophilin B)